MSLSFLLGVVQQGLLFGIMVLGVYITFRILNYADLTVDGSFTLGASVASVLIINGWNPLLATLIATLAGATAGLFTGFLHTRLGITTLLSGILTMTALYSLNLRIMGKANLSLLREKTLITMITSWGVSKDQAVFILAGISLILVLLLLDYFLKTDYGLALRASGDNEDMIRSLGVNTDNAKCLGLALANGLVALSGAEIAQFTSFSDVNMGIGMIVIGLASVIIGEAIYRKDHFPQALMAVVAGSVTYRIVIGFVLILGVPATDLKLISAVLVIVALGLPNIRKKYFSA